MNNVLIIEDDAAISELLSLNLEQAGFQVTTAFTIKDSKNKLSDKVDITLLDLNLPDGDGRDLMPLILEKNIPVIMLTARNSISDKVRGLNLGADDYIEKPFQTPELIARIHAVLRRSSSQSDITKINDLDINFNEKSVYKNGHEIDLTSKEWNLLEYFLNNTGYVLSREKLLDAIWGYDYYGNTRTVDVHIQKLRQKLDLNNIKTLYKQGYRFDR